MLTKNQCKELINKYNNYEIIDHIIMRSPTDGHIMDIKLKWVIYTDDFKHWTYKDEECSYEID